jgi:hypothetical protein
MSETNGHREQLEQRANEVRAKLEQRLHVIDERGHRLANVARAAARPPVSIVLCAVAGAAAALFIIHKVRARPSFAERLARLLQPALPPPERKKSLLMNGVQEAATSLAVVAAQRAGKRGLDRWLAEQGSAPTGW